MRKSIIWMIYGIFGVLFPSCRFPWFPENRQEIAEHLAKDFYGVYLPDQNILMGCRWERWISPIGGHIAGCKGVWSYDRSSGTFTPIKDTGRVLGALEVSRNFRYFAYIRTMGEDTFGHVFLDAVAIDLSRGDTSVIPNVSGSFPLRPSPYTPWIFYTSSTENFGRTGVVWRLDFQRGVEERVRTCEGGEMNFLVLAGAKGDSVICDRFVGAMNFQKGLVLWPPTSPKETIKVFNWRDQKIYRVEWTPVGRTNPLILTWVHDRDTILVGTIQGDGPGWTPERWDLWWIPSVTEHMVELSPGGNP
jgi:hypothetical protein